jgi:hypothetical protein
LFAGILPLQAGAVYQTTWTAIRGTASNDGTSYGAYTVLDTSWNFQGSVVPGNFSWIMTLPLGVMDPATATDRTWTNGPGEFSATFFVALPDGSGGVTISPLVLDSTNVQPGGASFTMTRVGANVRFSGSITYTGLLASSGQITINGNITAGVGGAPDSNASSVVHRDGTLLNVARINGPAYILPEPSTGLLTSCAGGLLLARVIASRRRSRPTA